ncbi:lysophosphatidic acid receptor 6 [Halichoeres trimaculatus]|uniref:lysophosphatidic acid receptor 6 n=1 Tax=Halichoeres trimaculatus TaxID=147232 RepID=UPI003D9F5462
MNNCSDDGNDHVNIPFVSIYSFITVVGLILNLIALVVFRNNGKSRSHTVTYMTNLACADLLLILTLPMRIYYHLGFSGLPQKMCNMLGLVLKANMYSSIFLLTSICSDRCLAITYPMSARVQGIRKKARWICLGIWLLTFGASVPIYFLKKEEEIQTNCFDSQPLIAIQPFVVFPTLFVGFGIPLVIMLICSWCLVRAVQRSTVAQTDLVDSSKISKMIAASLFIFLISFLPYHAALLVLSLNRHHITCSMTVAYRYSLLVACFNTVLDPVAYYFTTDTFRRKMDMGACWKLLPLNSHSSDLNRRMRAQEDS